MKILVVDDNPSIRSILKEILTEEGHNVRLAQTVDEAIFKTQAFEPDIVFLDSLIGADDGVRYLGRLSDELPDLHPAVVYLKEPSEIVPGDSQYVRASVDKPFRSEDIIGALKDAIESLRPPEPEKRGRRVRRRSRRDRPTAPTEEAMESHGVRFGRSYVIFTRNPEEIHRFISLFDLTRYNLMVITTGRAKAIEERFSYGKMDVVPLSANGKAGSLGIREMGTMTERIKEFIDSRSEPVIIFDGFDDIIAADGTNAPLMMIQQVHQDKSKDCTVALSVDPASLTEKDRSILLHSMSEYSTEE